MSDWASTTPVFSGMGEASGAKGQAPAQSGGKPARGEGESEEEEEMRQLEEALRMSRMTFVEDDPELAEVSAAPYAACACIGYSVRCHAPGC